MATKAATPWGQATIVEELELPQDADGKPFAAIVQLLEADSGERLVRFAYSTDGTARRGPVTLRTDDVKALRRALEDRPALGAALGYAADEARSARPRGRRGGEARAKSS